MFSSFVGRKPKGVWKCSFFFVGTALTHGSSEGHEMLKRNDKYHSITGDVPIPKCNFYQNRSMAFFKNCTFVFDTISFSLAAWLSPLLTRRPAVSSPTE